MRSHHYRGRHNNRRGVNPRRAPAPGASSPTSAIPRRSTPVAPAPAPAPAIGNARDDHRSRQGLNYGCAGSALGLRRAHDRAGNYSAGLKQSVNNIAAGAIGKKKINIGRREACSHALLLNRCNDLGIRPLGFDHGHHIANTQAGLAHHSGWHGSLDNYLVDGAGDAHHCSRARGFRDGAAR
jgi:hypothetical protein